MKKEMTIGYQNRVGRSYGGTGVGSLSGDLPTVPMIRIANKFLSDFGFNIGEKIEICYAEKEIIIKKLI